VLRLVAEGYTYKEIADQLFLSTKTVQNHVQNILTQAAAVAPRRAHALRDPARPRPDLMDRCW
jgi:DNA-binding NarL/FixJ family response regulator